MSALRAQRRVLGALLALAVAAVGALLVVEAGNRLFGGDAFVLVDHPTAVDDLSARPWSNGAIRASAAAAVLLGLVVLVTAIRPTPRALEMTARDGIRCEIPPAEVARVLELAAGRVSGVRSARAKVGRRTARVKASTRLREPGGLEAQVAASCQERLDALMLADPPRTRVSVRAGQR